MNSFAYKLRPNSSLADLAFYRLTQATCSHKDFVEFPTVFSVLCSSLSLPKPSVWKIIHYLQKRNKIEIIAGHGIRIKGKVEGVKK